MKEIIYLDKTLVNSFLAQMNKGLITKLINEESILNSKIEAASESTTKGNEAGVATPVTAKLSDSATITDAKEVVYSSSNRDLIETALDDFSLDVLINSLSDLQLIKTDGYEIGNFISLKDNLSSYDFRRLTESSKLEKIQEILPGYTEYLDNRQKLSKIKGSNKDLPKNKQLSEIVEKDGWNNIHLLNTMSSYMNTLFPNSTLIKIADTLCICSNNLFRISEEQLSILNYTNRKASMIGIVSSKFNETMPNFKESLEVITIFKNAPNIFSNIMLGSNEIIEAGDFIIRPIAIYFEY
ncbi:DUF6414 family protein [Streptococcus uberis]